MANKLVVSIATGLKPALRDESDTTR